MIPTSSLLDSSDRRVATWPHERLLARVAVTIGTEVCCSRRSLSVYSSVAGGTRNRGVGDTLVRAAAHFPVSSARGLVPPQPGQRLAPVPMQKSENLSTRFGSALVWDLPNFRRQGPAAARRGEPREEATVQDSLDLASVDLLQSGLECRQANCLLSHWIWTKTLSSHSLPLHASSILLAQLENNVAEVFTPPNASVSPEFRVLSCLVPVLSCMPLRLLSSCFLPFLLPIRHPTFPTLAWGPS